MGVEVRHTSGEDWEALAVPPPGQHIAYADCANYITIVARALRALYGVRLTRIEASTSAPTGWMNSGGDAADAVVRMTAERRRRSVAAIQSGATEPFAPSVSVPPEPSASTAPSRVELTARGTTQSKVSLDLSVNRAGAGAAATDIAAKVERRLGERPTEIREAARKLSKTIADQIAELNASKPNEADRLAQQNDFIAFLQTIAAGLRLPRPLTALLPRAPPTSLSQSCSGRPGKLRARSTPLSSRDLNRNRTTSSIAHQILSIRGRLRTAARYRCRFDYGCCCCAYECEPVEE